MTPEPLIIAFLLGLVVTLTVKLWDANQRNKTMLQVHREGWRAWEELRDEMERGLHRAVNDREANPDRYAMLADLWNYWNAQPTEQIEAHYDDMFRRECK